MSRPVSFNLDDVDFEKLTRIAQRKRVVRGVKITPRTNPIAEVLREAVTQYIHRNERTLVKTQC